MPARHCADLASCSTVLALSLLAGTPAEANDTLKVLHQARQAADGVASLGDGTVAEIADQVSTAVAVAETGLFGAAIATGSGAVIMKTLAAAGGPVTAAGATSLGAAHLVNKALYADCTNQSACDAAQVGSYAGAVMGTGATALTVAATGAGPASLAAIGATVGGGMAAGVGLLVAAPVVAAIGLSGLVYWLASD